MKKLNIYILSKLFILKKTPSISFVLLSTKSIAMFVFMFQKCFWKKLKFYLFTLN